MVKHVKAKNCVQNVSRGQSNHAGILNAQQHQSAIYRSALNVTKYLWKKTKVLKLTSYINKKNIFLSK